jgi:hypothetical protein
MPPRLVFTGVCPVSFARRPFATSVGGNAVTCRAQITRPFSVFLTARRGAFCRVISASLWAPLRQLHQRSGAAGASFGQLGCACHWPLACPFSPHHRTPVHPIVWTGHRCVLPYDLQLPTRASTDCTPEATFLVSVSPCCCWGQRNLAGVDPSRKLELSAHQQTPKPCCPPHEPVASPSAHDAGSSKGQQLQVPRLHDDRILRGRLHYAPIVVAALTVPGYMHAAIIIQICVAGTDEGRFRRAGTDARV